MSYELLVAITRGDLDESVHFGAVVVADAEGKVLASAGSPGTVTFLRSTAKPLQALPLLESGAADHFRLTPSETAIAIGSHGGEPRHVETVRGILAKIGLSEEFLMCGAHPPYHKPSARALEQENRRPSALHNNCSGKHAGMLALAKFRGEPPEGYFRPEHAVQREILEAVAAMTKVPRDTIHLAIDGCSAPTFGVPLEAAAGAFARLMEPDGYPSGLRYAARRAVEAMVSHPEMVAGEGRLDTDLMTASRGALIAKAGAEGFYGVGFHKGGHGYGIAFKVADGESERARTAMVLRALQDLEIMDAPRLDEVAAAHLPQIKNRRGVVVGKVEARFHLKPAFAAA
jgi:L-asparaginase II